MKVEQINPKDKERKVNFLFKFMEYYCIGI